MSKRHFITTAIDYPNAAPHMGHVLEKVLADVLARWKRVSRDPLQYPKGDDAVKFQIGTDEHGIKIQQTAKKQQLTPEELVDKNVPIFESLYEKLMISADQFIRTSDRPVTWKQSDKLEHKPTVEELWNRLMNAGMLEERTYKGLYCSGCERFVTKKDLIDGKCPDHGIAPEEVEETNVFFLLSKETTWLKEELKKKYSIVPEFRAPETFALLEGGLEDVSFSRPKASLSWGIPVPGMRNQTMYVWCDALTNYISGLDYFRNKDSAKKWWDDAEVTHVIGKDIARFHALIWPAMLKHAGVRSPDRLLIHGFLTSEGHKMSKSLGNVVAPDDVLKKYDIDALRCYLLHEIPVGNDGDFSWKRFGELYDSKLRNQLGNLLNRVLVLMNKEGGKFSTLTDKAFVDSDKWKMYEVAMDDFLLSQALQIVFGIVSDLNEAIDTWKVWALPTAEKVVALTELSEALRHVSLMLIPFLPKTAQAMAKQLNVPYADEMLTKDFVLTKDIKAWGGVKDWKTVGTPSILFAPIQ